MLSGLISDFFISLQLYLENSSFLCCPAYVQWYEAIQEKQRPGFTQATILYGPKGSSSQYFVPGGGLGLYSHKPPQWFACKAQITAHFTQFFVPRRRFSVQWKTRERLEFRPPPKPRLCVNPGCCFPCIVSYRCMCAARHRLTACCCCCDWLTTDQQQTVQSPA